MECQVTVFNFTNRWSTCIGHCDDGHGWKKEHYSDLKFLTLTFVKFQNICYSLRKVIPALLMLEISTDHMWIWLALPILDCVRQVYYLCGLWHSIVSNSAFGAKATWEIVSPLTLQVYTAALHHLLTMIRNCGQIRYGTSLLNMCNRWDNPFQWLHLKGQNGWFTWQFA